jgi:hypothetical protein
VGSRPADVEGWCPENEDDVPLRTKGVCLSNFGQFVGEVIWAKCGRRWVGFMAFLGDGRIARSNVSSAFVDLRTG